MQSESSFLSENDALRLARRGDAAAFEWLYRLHSQRVYSLCLRMVKNPTQAEDLTQDTFLAVLRGIRAFRGQSAFTTWLHQVTRNTVLMRFRKKKLEESSLEEITDRQDQAGRPRKEWGTPDQRLEGTPDRLLLQSAVARLSGGFRTALVLHDVHGYEHREVAAMLGWATGTSKSQVHKARLHVRRMLKKVLHRDSLDHNGFDDASKNDPDPSPAPIDEKVGSGREKASLPSNALRRSGRTVPRWCDPIADDPPASEK
jgi:RNA polymerase sigma-70 factor (ECF subfamily)